VTNNIEQDSSVTDHGHVVVWGQYAATAWGCRKRLRRCLVQEMRLEHTPQSKVLEFLVARSGRTGVPERSQPFCPSFGQRPGRCAGLGPKQLGGSQRRQSNSEVCLTETEVVQYAAGFGNRRPGLVGIKKCSGRWRKG